MIDEDKKSVQTPTRGTVSTPFSISNYRGIGQAKLLDQIDRLKKRVEELEKELSQYRTEVCICGHIKPISEKGYSKCGQGMGEDWPRQWIKTEE